MHLLRAIELARLSRAKCNHPFGSLLVDASGRVVLEAENTVVTEHDVTGHAELNLVRRASMQFDFEALEGVTLYASLRVVEVRDDDADQPPRLVVEDVAD